MPITLEMFDDQMRWEAGAEWAGGVLRKAGDGWCGVIHSDLDETSADAAIAEQVRYFAERRQPFEWKYYTHDRPADLPDRLAAAGLRPDVPEAVMVADIADVPLDATPPAGVEFVPVTDAAGIGLLIKLHDEVFGGDFAVLGQALLDADPDTVTPVLAMAGDQAVCAARIEYRTGTDFASLWGGGTLPQWRGRGIYRALVAYRARLAKARGVRYLHVDASPDSRPILERIGFTRLAATVPYHSAPYHSTS
jgi:GNAT superfamily N-acetyltransferase